MIFSRPVSGFGRMSRKYEEQRELNASIRQILQEFVGQNPSFEALLTPLINQST
jgi:hypothetical protein